MLHAHVSLPDFILWSGAPSPKVLLGSRLLINVFEKELYPYLRDPKYSPPSHSGGRGTPEWFHPDNTPLLHKTKMKLDPRRPHPHAVCVPPDRGSGPLRSHIGTGTGGGSFSLCSTMNPAKAETVECSLFVR